MTHAPHGQGPGPGPGPAGLPWPAGRPGQIREAARRVDALGAGLADVGGRARPLAEVEGWTGPAAVTWSQQVVEHADALDDDAPPLRAAGRALHALADEMEQARAAIDRLAEDVLDAEAVADRAARHAVEVRRAWLGGLGLAPGAAPPPDLVPPDRVSTADAAAIGAADDAADVLRRAVLRARARRDEVRACDRRAAALLERAGGAAPGDDVVGWCGTTTGPRPPHGPQWVATGSAHDPVPADGVGTGLGWQPAEWAEPVRWEERDG